MNVSGQLTHVVFLKDSVSQQVIRSPEMFREGWQYLPQVKFWRRIMRLDPKYSYVNVADTRQILMQVSTDRYNHMSYARKEAFKDSLLAARSLPLSTRLFVTTGKSDFYQTRKAIPSINESIGVFIQEGVDPWYAQAILLIESPGANLHSSVGAAGQFQLMKDVAISNGLVVNSRVDERLILAKAAKGAARLIDRVCLPQTRAMLDSYGVSYKESDLWFRLLVLHVYHAGAGNVKAAMAKIRPTEGGMDLIRQMWQTSASGFQNASQNYTQIAISALIELEVVVRYDGEIVMNTPRKPGVQ
ncbi:MAG: hypothetical protein NWR72_15230 [Bacteroidia bacterium]|nr:hypothetical protein [Bacteroidia bacterium]